MSRALVMSDYADPDTEIERLNAAIRRLDVEMAEWHEKVLRQERVIEAARIYVNDSYPPGVPYDKLRFDALADLLAALEGKLE